MPRRRKLLYELTALNTEGPCWWQRGKWVLTPDWTHNACNTRVFCQMRPALRALATAPPGFILYRRVKHGGKWYSDYHWQVPEAVEVTK